MPDEADQGEVQAADQGAYEDDAEEEVQESPEPQLSEKSAVVEQQHPVELAKDTEEKSEAGEQEEQKSVTPAPVEEVALPLDSIEDEQVAA